MTGSVAAITVAGAWYGAGLKIKNEAKTVRPISFISYLDSLNVFGCCADRILFRLRRSTAKRQWKSSWRSSTKNEGS